jgi:2-polyprenyl-3-methyl-5-hydroxy-6-metoxy-1,4-benzoquinol methylase
MARPRQIDQTELVGKLRNVAANFQKGVIERGINRTWNHYLYLLRQLRPFLELLPTGARVCDIGAGVAVIPLVMAQLGFSVSVVDRWTEYSEEYDNQMGAAADFRARFSKFGVQPYTCDIQREAIPLPDASQDLVSAFAVIEHLSRPHVLLAEIKRLLKPGGLLVVTTPNCAHLRNRLRLFFGKSPYGHPCPDFYSDPFFGHYRELTRGELCGVFEREGYEILLLKTSNSSQVNTKFPDGTWGRHWMPTSPEQLARGLYLLAVALQPGLRYDMLLVGRKRERSMVSEPRTSSR